MACDSPSSLTQGKCLGHIFLLHHLNLMLSHLTFLYFNSLVYLRDSDCIYSFIDWSSSFMGARPRCQYCQPSAFCFHCPATDSTLVTKFLKSFNLLVDLEKLSYMTAVLWLLNSPLCLAAQVESRKFSISDLDHEPKGSRSAVLAVEQAEQHTEIKWRCNPQSFNFRSLVMGNSRASCMNSICCSEWRDQGE